MVSLLLRNLAFTILQPGIFAGLIPYLILKESKGLFKRPQVFYQYLALLISITGLTILLLCILRFAFEGQGTLSPIDPTKRLVTGGLYRFSRNPMYISVMMILIGESIYANSTSLWGYSFILFLSFNLFILLHEEPRLKKDFGEEYERYCKKVRRWI